MNRLDALIRLRRKLQNAELSIGSWMQIPDGSVAEIMGQGGYDWVAVDLEHGAIGPGRLPNVFRALELGGTLPLARLRCGEPSDCKTALDAGAAGVIIPMVDSADALRRAISACRWPPGGTRGVGFSRANLFGRYFESYRAEAQQPLVVAQIEHVRAVENLAEILRVDGLDAIMVGPYDLSASMGLTGEFEHADFKKAIETIRGSAARHRVPYGVHVVEPSPEVLAAAVAQGARFVAYSMDAVFLEKASRRPSIGKS